MTIQKRQARRGFCGGQAHFFLRARSISASRQSPMQAMKYRATKAVAIARGAVTGNSTIHHDKAICPVNLSVKRTTKRAVRKSRMAYASRSATISPTSAIWSGNGLPEAARGSGGAAYPHPVWQGGRRKTSQATSGRRASQVTSPPVANSMAMARSGEMADFPDAICDKYDRVMPSSLARRSAEPRPLREKYSCSVMFARLANTKQLCQAVKCLLVYKFLTTIAP